MDPSFADERWCSLAIVWQVGGLLRRASSKVILYGSPLTFLSAWILGSPEVFHILNHAFLKDLTCLISLAAGFVPVEKHPWLFDHADVYPGSVSGSGFSFRST